MQEKKNKNNPRKRNKYIYKKGGGGPGKYMYKILEKNYGKIKLHTVFT